MSDMPERGSEDGKSKKNYSHRRRIKRGENSRNKYHLP